jgi:hypothetical protein
VGNFIPFLPSHFYLHTFSVVSVLKRSLPACEPEGKGFRPFGHPFEEMRKGGSHGRADD